jgi:diguanylate cyclase (GGDEF)-like protein/PAS domain S-box-containing protein
MSKLPRSSPPHEITATLAAIDRSQAVIEFALDGTILTANKNFLTMMGYSLDEVRGKHHRMFLESAYGESPQYREFWRSLSHGEYQVAQFKRLGKCGKEVWIEGSYNPILDRRGKPFKVVKYATNITANKMGYADLRGQVEAIYKSAAVIEFSLDGIILTANQAFLDVTGYALADIQGQHHRMFIEETYRTSPEYHQFWEQLRRGEYQSAAFKRLGKGGKEIWIQASYNPILDLNGKPFKVINFVTDVGLVEANTRLELDRQRIEAVLANITHGVCLFDGTQRLLVWNRRYIEIYDLPPEAVCVGRSLKEIVDFRHTAGSGPDISPSDYLIWRDQLGAANQPSSRVVTLNNGHIVEIHYQPMSDGGWVATHEDVTTRQQAEARIAFMAEHDTLTGLANRALFRDRLEHTVAMAGRGHQFAIMSLDLDYFKRVNDTLGHPIGDGLLQAVAGRLRTCTREGDTIARLGGDEFAIIQLDVGQPEQARALVQRIVGTFVVPFNVGDHQIAVGISIGVAIAPRDGASSETLLKSADVALYLAKTEGRGSARFFEPEMDARLQMRRTLELDLREAILRDEFELYYQPLINLAAGRIIGFEALLRWNHPIRGLVAPADFIPVAEETGMIVAIGEWVLRMACFEAENWPTDIGVAINLSPIQFRKGDLVATVQAALAASGLRPGRLELEITESVLLHDSLSTLTALHQLRAMGVAVALDDFGTGYSSLSYLRSFPFDKIKIDQSFVRDLVNNKESMSIIRAVTDLGHSLSMKTTAEGVETMDQLNRLREQGCTEVQGYLFSRPRPAGELPPLIERLQRTGEHQPELMS